MELGHTGVKLVDILSKLDKSNLKTILIVIYIFINLGQTTSATQFSPSDVFAQVNHANQLTSELLKDKGITDYKLPSSRESQANPMHVYELHVSVLAELYKYALSEGFRPPPIVVSTPISYKPTDVYYLSELVVKKLEEIHHAKLAFDETQKNIYTNKTPVQVYQEVFELFYRLNLLNGNSKVSPSIVFSHVTRIREDLQTTLIFLSKKLERSENNERKKRLLTTATFGTHPDGANLGNKSLGKTPADVIKLSFSIRESLNRLRAKYDLPRIEFPKEESFSKVLPVDVFLQTQFIIAELNLIKQPMNINTTTNRGKLFKDKTPSDVFYVLQHVDYMVERLLAM